MGIRVTQKNMYDNMTSQMQKTLAAYMDSNEQGSTQKKINRPSDDPAGTYRVLMTRNDISATTQYQSNVDTATGWLSLADNVLGTQLSNSLTSLKALAEQASTGTYTAETFAVSKGRVVTSAISRVEVRKIGFEGAIARFADEQSFFYGLFAVAISVLMGWLAGRLFALV